MQHGILEFSNLDLLSWKHFKMMLYAILVSTLMGFSVTAENIQVSKLFIFPMTPETFNWEIDGRYDQFLYQPSLLNAPDLPPWIHYTYSKRNHKGFLYGVAPLDQANFQLEIVGLNKHTYETRYKIVDINVRRKDNPAKNEVHLKIDNLNVEEMFDSNRTEKLLDIFRNKLWRDASDLYVTFLASAIEMGARLPLKPGEGDGVVLRLGSHASFSKELHELQEEVKPLSKLSTCPRDFKRTTVEILFRSEEFHLDWCSFRLIEEDHSLHQESARRDPNMNVIGFPSSGIFGQTEWRWAQPTKAGTPTRSYFKEMATTFLIPATLLFILVGFLSAALCLHHNKSTDPESHRYFFELFNVCVDRKRVASPKREPTPVEGLGNGSEVQMVQYASSQRGTLRSLSAQPSSPGDSLSRSPRTSVERCNPYLRPNPPPYMGPNNPSESAGNFYP